MSDKAIYIGNNKVSIETNEVKGQLVEIENESYYKIANNDAMRPFFMSIVSDANHWMFLASNGGLTAGRKDADMALFPYYTDDKITESANITGCKTLLQIHSEKKIYLWEPFSDKYRGIYKISRNLYKNSLGNKIIFEEINQDLGLTFRYQWNSSNLYGFVKKSTLINNTGNSLKIRVLDGIQNIVPYGVSADMQNTKSNLVDAYKKSELVPASGLGIFALSAIIVDKAEPSEALKATSVWSLGLEDPVYLLSSLQLDNFRKGKQIKQETEIKAEKGAYFTCSSILLQPEIEKNWMLIANVNQNISAINQISALIQKEDNLANIVQKDIEKGSQHLLELTGASDGLQLTADKLRDTRHFANTMFNIMRGGIFDDNYQIEKDDFVKYITKANKKVLKKKETLLKDLPDLFTLMYLKELAQDDEDKNFKRLCFEYMPLKFSRRHGDPSRPWNKFSINTTNEIDGSKILDYEGNWRDIFQNWEALAHAYPQFIESMIHKFLNATTFDGYNPYRVTKGGFDWEVIEPDDPWSYIGYWGDHQIIYLLKFLEFMERHYPKALANYFDKELFVYANVPYKIKSYSDILKNPKDTIEFDNELHGKILQKKTELGVDGALLRDENYFIYKVNLIEKLLVTVLAKVSNFIPEAGIWLNTQRPEWNDANNALVGNGVSMVTLYYLRRFINFFEGIVDATTIENIEISEELGLFFSRVVATFNENQHLLAGKISNADRKTVLDGLGNAGSDYRTGIYENGFSSNKSALSKDDLLQFFALTKKFLEHTIDANKRADKLYHAYNLMTLENASEISISYLPEMLEGQVAVLSADYISANDSLALLNSLKKSALYRKDQSSYILYPNKELAGFEVKNNIPANNVKKSALLQQLVKDGNSQIIEKDILGKYHFNGNFNNAKSLKAALSALPVEKYEALVEKDHDLVLHLFEEVFDHKSFTGRSGTFFGYEGLGSIYWHMVSKLALSVQEVALKAMASKDKTADALWKHYREINEGIGVHKSPKLYGAFPTDPYSHTPAGKGAQQPGMTGQVKEDILTRFAELGVFVIEGKLSFNPNLLDKEEFLKATETFEYTNVKHQKKAMTLEKNRLCFTYCQVPIIYQISNKNSIEISFTDGSVQQFKTLSMDHGITSQIFGRTGDIEKIIVSIIK